MTDLMIKGGTVITMCGEIIENGIVAMDNGLITYVGRHVREEASQVIDAGGCAVMPGLVNAHTHLPMTLLRGYADGLPYKEWTEKIRKAESKLTPEYVRAGAYLGVLEMIRSGTTSFADMYIYMDEVAKVVEETGIRAALGYGMIEGLNEKPEIKLKNREKFREKWNNNANGRITTMYAPHSAASCSKEFLMKIKYVAKKDNALIHIHLLETKEELDLMKERYGMCSVNLLNSINMLSPNLLAAHCIWLSDDDVDILKHKGVNVVHCPSSNMALGTGIAHVPEMLEKGLNVALGTDSAASGISLDMWKEMRMAMLLHRINNPEAMTAHTVLKMATVNGAKALGINAGKLTAGSFADVIIVDLNRPQFARSDIITGLVNGANGCDVKTTIVNGKVLMKDHIMKGLDEERIIKEAKKAISRLEVAR